MQFLNRQKAGEQLGQTLQRYRNSNVIVYALPRGGAVVGAGVARALHAPLDLLITRKIGHPYNPEYAIAAVAETGEMVANEQEVSHIDRHWLRQESAKEMDEAKRRRQVYLHGRQMLNPADKICIVVDDGLATGLTMKAALLELRSRQPKLIVVAVPVAPAETIKEIENLADEIVTLYVPAGAFMAISNYYVNFPQTTDREVIKILANI